jgi:hypothetical protein
MASTNDLPQIIHRREIEPGDWTVLCIDGNSRLFLADDPDLQEALFSWEMAILLWREGQTTVAEKAGQQ